MLEEKVTEGRPQKGNPLLDACAGIAQLAQLMASCVVTHSRDGKAPPLGDADCGGISLLFSLLLTLKAKKQFSFLSFFF